MLTKRSGVLISARCFRALLVCSLFMVGWARAASADTVYTYTGKPFTNSFGSFFCPTGVLCAVAGSFTVAQALPANQSGLFAVGPTSFSFGDGGVTNTSWTESTITAASFAVSTDSTGNIQEWTLGLEVGAANLDTENLGTGNQLDRTFIFNGVTVTDSAFNSGMPGTWTMSTVPTTVPEPASLLLFGTGLAALARSFWKKRAATGR
jgi:hypothetical protein